MRLISGIRVKSFRSIKDLEVHDWQDYNPLIGVNDTGKSNLLRALSLFFTGETSPGVPLDMTKDANIRVRGRKEIIIDVLFNLPGTFVFKKRIADVEKFLGRSFCMRKRWTLDYPEPELFLQEHTGGQFKKLQGDQAGWARQFLNLVTFRYIPADRNALRLLGRQTTASIMKELKRRAKLKESSADSWRTLEKIPKEVMSSFQDLALPLSDILAKAVDSAESVSIAVPEDVAAFFATATYSIAETDKTKLTLDLHGSGVQNFLVFLMLHFADTSFSKDFGWKEACVWAIEEPELSLHRRLESDLGHFLHRETSRKENRFQVFFSTHSDTLLYPAREVYYFILRQGHTVVERLSVNTALERAGREGVSPFVPPLLRFVREPLLLAEGRHDVDILLRYYELKGRIAPFRIISLEDITGEPGAGGVTAIRSFVRNHQAELAARPVNAPILIALDWDVRSSDVTGISKLIPERTNCQAVAMDVGLSNPELDQSFKGIERYYCTRVVELAHTQNILPVRQPHGGGYPLSVLPGDYTDETKRGLKELFLKEASLDDFRFVESIIQSLEHLMGEMIQGQLSL